MTENQEVMKALETIKNSNTLKTISVAEEVLSSFTKTASTTDSLELCDKIIEWSQEQKKLLLWHKTLFFQTSFLIESFLSCSFNYNSNIPSESDTDKKIENEKEELLVKKLEEVKERFSLPLLYFKRKDSRLNLVKSYILLGHSYYLLGRVKDARSLLTSARASAASAYIPRQTQLDLDRVSGLIFLELGEYDLAANSFLEYLNNGGEAVFLQYYLLSQIQSGSLADSKRVLRKHYSGLSAEETVGLERVARYGVAVGEEDVSEFSKCIKDFESVELGFYEKRMLETMKKSFSEVLERNVLSVVKSYSRISIEELSRSVGVEDTVVEKVLFDSIVGGKLEGWIDEGKKVFVRDTEVKDEHEEFISESIILLKYLLNNIDRKDSIVEFINNKIC